LRVCEISSSNGSSSVNRFFVSGPAAVEVNSDSLSDSWPDSGQILPGRFYPVGKRL
jgi:hypothetical protein